jgi:hypothetical protein
MLRCAPTPLQASLQLNSERSARVNSEQAVIKLRSQLEAIAQVRLNGWLAGRGWWPQGA